jgi:predicted nucleic-acid-binding protein
MLADANVLLRGLDGSESPHSEAVRKRIEAARADGLKFTVLSATVLEVVYVLESAQAGYGWNRRDISSAVSAIVNEPAFDVEHGEPLAEAAAVYGSRSIDLHDCLLAAIAGRDGTRVLTFDADLRKLGVAEQP